LLKITTLKSQYHFTMSFNKNYDLRVKRVPIMYLKIIMCEVNKSNHKREKTGRVVISSLYDFHNILVLIKPSQ
jgi:hypothetical protein